MTYCYNILRPRNVMPVHGEVRHLIANGAIAVKTGVPPKNVILAEDGVVVDLVDGQATIVGAVPCGYVYVDGSSVGEITEAELKDRKILSEEGFISLFAVVDASTGKVVGGPQILARGLLRKTLSLMTFAPRLWPPWRSRLRQVTPILTNCNR